MFVLTVSISVVVLLGVTQVSGTVRQARQAYGGSGSTVTVVPSTTGSSTLVPSTTTHAVPSTTTQAVPITTTHAFSRDPTLYIPTHCHLYHEFCRFGLLCDIYCALQCQAVASPANTSASLFPSPNGSTSEPSCPAKYPSTPEIITAHCALYSSSCQATGFFECYEHQQLNCQAPLQNGVSTGALTTAPLCTVLGTICAETDVSCKGSCTICPQPIQFNATTAVYACSRPTNTAAQAVHAAYCGLYKVLCSVYGFRCDQLAVMQCGDLT